MIRFGDAYKNIKFRGIDLTAMHNLVVVNLEEHKEELFGVDRNTSYINNVFLEVSENRSIIDVIFLRERNGVPLDIDEVFLNDISKVFYQSKEPVVMEIGQKCYRVLALGGSIKNIGEKGYFTVRFEAEPYAFNIAITNITITDSNSPKQVELKNIGVTNIYFDLALQVVEDGELIINNNGNTITLKGIAGQKLLIHGEEYDSTGDIDWDCTSDAFLLRTGINRITVEGTGFWKMYFKCESKLAI